MGTWLMTLDAGGRGGGMATCLEATIPLSQACHLVAAIWRNSTQWGNLTKGSKVFLQKNVFFCFS